MASSRPVKETGWKLRNGIFFGIIESETNHGAHLLVVDPVDDGDHRHDVDAGLPQIFNGAHLDIEQVPDGAMGIGIVADSVELQIRVAQAGFGGLFAELRAFRELDAIGGRLHAVVADVARVADSIQEVGRQRRLAA